MTSPAGLSTGPPELPGSIEAFTAWYTQRHAAIPDPDAVEALAYEWLKGALPGTERVVAPARITFIRALMSDWIPDDPVTTAATALLPDWVLWNGEQDHLPAHLLDPAVAIATATTVPTTRHPTAEPDRVP